MIDPATDDLRAALRRRSPQQIAELLHRVPALAEALQGRGLLAAVGPFGLVYPTFRTNPEPTMERLALLLGSTAGIDMVLSSLDRFALQLVTLAVWHGGRLDRDTALAEVGADRGDDLDAAAATLADLLLTDPHAGWLVLRPGVDDVIGLPGVPVRDYVDGMTSDALRDMLRRLGVDRPPARKMERMAALQARLRDPEAVSGAVRGLSEDAIRVLDVLLSHGVQRVADVGVPYYTPWHRGDTPIHELVGCGLVGVDSVEQVCWVWLDVMVGLNGRLFPQWPSPAAIPDPQPLRENPGLPSVLGRLAALLHQWADEPAPALQTGALGVRPVRAAAKALGMSGGEVGLLASVAVSLGLLGRIHQGSKGRGRTRTDTWAWAPTPLADQYAALPADHRWALLVQAWRDDVGFDETEGLPERVEEAVAARGCLARSMFLRLLRALPEGSGLALDDLTAWAEAATSGALQGPAVGHVAQAARILGLVPPDGPIGLTTLARGVLDGPEALAAALPPPRSEFTVQADLSVVAPPDLAPDIAGRLERYAELESHAGARLYRLSERRIATALGAGDTAADILAFLAEHATAALAQNVEYLIRDCERRHGQLRAGACVSYVRADDPALLTAAMAVKAAKLRLLAPTVAVSSLPRAKVVAALRARGLLPVAEDADGLALQSKTAEAVPVMSAGKTLPALRDALEVRRVDAEALAERLVATPEPAAGASGRRSTTYLPDPPWVDLDAMLDGDDGEDELTTWLHRHGRRRA